MVLRISSFRLLSECDAGYWVNFDANRLAKTRRDDLEIESLEDLRANIKYMVDHYIEMCGTDYSINISSSMRLDIIQSFRDWEGLASDGKLVAEVPISVDTPDTEHVPDAFPATDPTLNAELSGEYQEVRMYTTLLDSAMKEVMRLMKSDSMPRFTRTADYKALRRTSKRLSDSKAMKAITCIVSPVSLPAMIVSNSNSNTNHHVEVHHMERIEE